MKKLHSDDFPPAAVVAIPLRVAILINNGYLPINPNKIRTAHPEVKIAVMEFQDAIERAAKAHKVST